MKPKKCQMCGNDIPKNKKESMSAYLKRKYCCRECCYRVLRGEKKKRKNNIIQMNGLL